MVHAARIALAILALILSTTAVEAAPSCKGSAVVTDAATAMMGAARKRSPAAFSGVAARYADMHSIAFFALGQHRDLLPKSREREYVALTHNFIGRTLARNSGRFRATGIRVTDCAGSGKSVTVNARLSGGQRLIFKLYRTR